MSRFEEFVKRLVISATRDKELVRSIVLVLAGHAADEFIKDKEIEVRLSSSLLEGQTGPVFKEEGKLAILGLSSDMLREGVELVSDSDIEGGARVRLVQDKLEIDLSDRAIARMISAAVAPAVQGHPGRGGVNGGSPCTTTWLRACRTCRTSSERSGCRSPAFASTNGCDCSSPHTRTNWPGRSRWSAGDRIACCGKTDAAQVAEYAALMASPLEPPLREYVAFRMDQQTLACGFAAEAGRSRIAGRSSAVGRGSAGSPRPDALGRAGLPPGAACTRGSRKRETSWRPAMRGAWSGC